MDTENYLRLVTIGEVEPHDGPIHLADYDPRWPSQFESLASRVMRALGGKAIILEHVGSTAVPELAAKPIIDIVLAVPDSADEPAYVPALEAEGFTLHLREPDCFEHRLLKSADINSNLHVFSAGCEEIARMLTFRDRLRADEGDRVAYEVAKRRLAKQTWKHVQDYADAKSAIVNKILSRSMA